MAKFLGLVLILALGLPMILTSDPGNGEDELMQPRADTGSGKGPQCTDAYKSKCASSCPKDKNSCRVNKSDKSQTSNQYCCCSKFYSNSTCAASTMSSDMSAKCDANCRQAKSKKGMKLLAYKCGDTCVCGKATMANEALLGSLLGGLLAAVEGVPIVGPLVTTLIGTVLSIIKTVVSLLFGTLAGLVNSVLGIV